MLEVVLGIICLEIVMEDICVATWKEGRGEKVLAPVVLVCLGEIQWLFGEDS